MKYRLYSFVNHLYMNEKQWGIQTAHCVSTMSVQAKKDQLAMYEEWAETEPTIIMCEGGNVAMLHDLYTRLKSLADSLGLPCVKFHEDEQSLGGVITSVAVLVPDTLFNCYASKEFEEDDTGERHPVFIHPESGKRYAYSDAGYEYEFLSIVKMARLA